MASHLRAVDSKFPSTDGETEALQVGRLTPDHPELEPRPVGPEPRARGPPGRGRGSFSRRGRPQPGGLRAAGPHLQPCPPPSCSASLFSAGETEAQLREGTGPVWQGCLPGRRPGGVPGQGVGASESLLSPRRPQAGWVKGSCSPPASPPTWAQTMGLCARRGRVVKVRGPGPEPWPQPPRGQGGRARGSAGAGKSSRRGSGASLLQSQQRKPRHREGAPRPPGHTAPGHQRQDGNLGRQPPSCYGLSVPAVLRGLTSLLLTPALWGASRARSPSSVFSLAPCPLLKGLSQSVTPTFTVPVSGGPPQITSATALLGECRPSQGPA